jgi:DNA-binding beta-propeller fold protein YncE
MLGTSGFKYECDHEWAKLPPDWQMPDVCSIAIDKDDNVYLGCRGEHPIIVFDRDGNFLKSWGEGLLKSAHGIIVGHDGMIYCADERDHTVRKFTPNGEMLLEVGIPGRPSSFMSGQPFNGCTDVALCRSGEFFVSDGYGNARIHKFSKEGKLLSSWGEAGSGPGQFNCVHNIVLDADENLYVCDRENHRIQVFDSDGKYMTEWRNLHRPNGMRVSTTANPLFYVTEIGPIFRFNMNYPNLGPRISILSTHGSVLSRIGDNGVGLGNDQFLGPHGIAVDSQGSIYVGEVSRAAWPDFFRNPVPEGIRCFRKLRKVE